MCVCEPACVCVCVCVCVSACVCVFGSERRAYFYLYVCLHIFEHIHNQGHPQVFGARRTRARIYFYGGMYIFHKRFAREDELSSIYAYVYIYIYIYVDRHTHNQGLSQVFGLRQSRANFSFRHAHIPHLARDDKLTSIYIYIFIHVRKFRAHTHQHHPHVFGARRRRAHF